MDKTVTVACCELCPAKSPLIDDAYVCEILNEIIDIQRPPCPPANCPLRTGPVTLTLEETP